MEKVNVVLLCITIVSLSFLTALIVDGNRVEAHDQKMNELCFPFQFAGNAYDPVSKVMRPVCYTNNNSLVMK